MKPSFSILVLFFIFCAAASFAQENEIQSADVPNTHSNTEGGANEDRALLLEHDSKNSKRDSIQSKNISNLVKQKGDHKPSSKEEDALSFNFLYYIIQKFKISDLVDN